ncbi:imelysin family protein [Thiocystis violascens]|uniref:imelysin family protein n=1 Tax=Thiocystis violascens TaxID=73141 RepID=UPI00022C10AE|nr:imelysin family protein [Thiocystis violascens]
MIRRHPPSGVPTGLVWLALAGALAAAGCSDPTAPIAPAKPQAVLSALVNQGAVPTMTRLAKEGKTLDETVRQLCRHPADVELERARDAWRSTYLAWRAAAPYLFGLADEVTMKRRLGSWPVNAVVLDHAVASDKFGHMRGADDLRGYAAVEYLLFLPVEAGAATADQRCAHLTDLTREIMDLTAGVSQR